MQRFTDFYASMHGGESVTPTALGYNPMVIEQSGRGERAYDIYSRLLKVKRSKISNSALRIKTTSITTLPLKKWFTTKSLTLLLFKS
jgi:hypothetical protein